MFKDFEHEINEIYEWYEITKEILIDSESLDSSKRFYFQPINELRYALDHIMRAYYYYCNSENEKVRKALRSARGHIQRTYADAIHWSLVSVNDLYEMMLKEIDRDIILQKFPEFYSSISPRIIEITKTIDDYRKNKSAENPAKDIEFAERFRKEAYMSQLKQFSSSLSEVFPVLLEEQTKRDNINIEDANTALSQLFEIANSVADKNLQLELLNNLNKLKSAIGEDEELDLSWAAEMFSLRSTNE